MKVFRFRPYHFALAFGILGIFSYFAGEKIFQHKTSPEEKSSLTNLEPSNMVDSISKGSCFVLFSTPESNLCDLMRQRLCELKERTTADTHFYEVDISQDKNLDIQYNISLVPLLIIFKEGKEQQRIMGIVPVSNMEMIRDRFVEKQGNNP